MNNLGSTRFFVDNMFMTTVQHGEYAREGGYGFSGGDISVVDDISYHCDVSQIPGSGVEYWTSTNSQSISWDKWTSGNWASFGTTTVTGYTHKDWINYTAPGTTAPLPNTK